VASGYEMRVSDAERDAAAAELREHFASGRLNQEELDERLASIFAAKTRGDLNALFTDLPPSGQGGPGASSSAGGRGFGAGTAGAGPWTRPGDADGGSAGWQARGGWTGSAGRGIGRIAVASTLLWVLLIIGILGVFGIGTGRPLGVVLIFAALALLRRVLFMIFGRRMRGGRGRGGRRRC
jgi:hypothetical protein